MDIEQMVESLYKKGSKDAYANLLKLEQISESENILYDYFDCFFKMIHDKNYAIRVRGYRLLCKQAKWDTSNKINKVIDKILTQLEDEKPTAVRQKIKALENIISNKKALNKKIKQKLFDIDCSKYKESMQGLISKDIENLLSLIKS